MPHKACQKKPDYVLCLGYDNEYKRCCGLAIWQFTTWLFFLSWGIIGLIAAFSTGTTIHHLWQFALSFSIIGGICIIIAQTIYIWSYASRSAAYMSPNHNKALYMGYFISIAFYVIILAFQWDWLARYGGSIGSMLNSPVVIPAFPIEPQWRAYNNLQVATSTLSFIATYILTLSIIAHNRPEKIVSTMSQH